MSEMEEFDRRELVRACQVLYWQLLFLLRLNKQTHPVILQFVYALGKVLPHLTDEQFFALVSQASNETMATREMRGVISPVDRPSHRFLFAADLAAEMRKLVPSEVQMDPLKDSLKIDGLVLTPFESTELPREERIRFFPVQDLRRPGLNPYHQIFARDLASRFVDLIPASCWERGSCNPVLTVDLPILARRVREMHDPQTRDLSFFPTDTVTTIVAPYFELANETFVEQERLLSRRVGESWSENERRPYHIAAYRELRRMEVLLQRILTLAGSLGL